MKKSIVLILLFIICFVSSCTSENIESKSIISNKDTLYSVSQDIMYLTFEETIDLATHIVLAEYIEMEDKGTYYDLLFKIEKQYKGNLIEDYLHVYCRKASVFVFDKGYSFDNLSMYIEGNSYVLLLERHISVYYEHDRFLVMSGILLPADKLNDLCIYGRQPLLSHSSLTKEDIKTFQSFENYITKKVKESPLQDKDYYGDEYIESDDIETIVKESNYIVRLRPKTHGDVLASGKTAIYECELIKQYKGNIDKKLIEVKFFINTVDLDSEYIVAMSSASNLYLISSKNSVMGVDKENQILSLLGK